jgi:hypothetical protein
MTPHARTSPRSHQTRLKKLPQRPPLSIEQIVQWADDYFAKHSKWPNVNSGYIPGTIDDTWIRIDNALRAGNRGLPKNTKLTLARLLAKRRGVRNSEFPPLLTEKQIVRWAKLHCERKGEWPKENSGPILDAVGETWTAIDLALRKGKRRGLPGGDSLARLLNRCCGVPFGCRPTKQLPPLTIRQILEWATEFVAKHGHRPNHNSGLIPEAAGDSWRCVDKALRLGRRGLPGSSSLAKLLSKHRPAWRSSRGLWAEKAIPRLNIPQILAWMDEYYSEHGCRPTRGSGPIAGSLETWSRVDNALKSGSRGLPGHSSLQQLQDENRPQWLPKRRSSVLTDKLILSWADPFYAEHGERPTNSSGAISGTFETWQIIDNALRTGSRGLRGGSSLSRFLDKHRPQWPAPGPWRNRRANPLTVKQILRWADRYHAIHRRRPVHTSGAIPGTTYSWHAIEGALRNGRHGLPGGFSLARLFAKYRPQWPDNRFSRRFQTPSEPGVLRQSGDRR